MAEVCAGVEETADAYGYSVILASSKTDPEREMKLVQSFEERRVDGILIIASRLGPVYVSALAEMKIPIVLVNSYHPGDFTYAVSIDNLAAARSATKFLSQLGHREIAFIGDRNGAQSNLDRQTGYKQALEAAGIPFRPELSFLGDSRFEGGVQALEHFRALSEPPSAILCYNDLTAIGVLNAAYRHNIPVPDGLSVVGFDDLTIASYVVPPLTTVRQPKREMGRKATEIVFNLLAGSTTERRSLLNGELILRESTAPPHSPAARLGSK
jgi:DNA-binding LacI/PurR family transcriptional regulator